MNLHEDNIVYRVINLYYACDHFNRYIMVQWIEECGGALLIDIYILLSLYRHICMHGGGGQ